MGFGDSLDDFELGIWDTTTLEVRAMKTPAFAPISVAWSPSQGILVAGEDTCGRFIICAD
jgi:hypothetical protein